MDRTVKGSRTPCSRSWTCRSVEVWVSTVHREEGRWLCRVHRRAIPFCTAWPFLPQQQQNLIRNMTVLLHGRKCMPPAHTPPTLHARSKDHYLCGTGPTESRQGGCDSMFYKTLFGQVFITWRTMGNVVSSLHSTPVESRTRTTQSLRELRVNEESAGQGRGMWKLLLTSATRQQPALSLACIHYSEGQMKRNTKNPIIRSNDVWN